MQSETALVKLAKELNNAWDFFENREWVNGAWVEKEGEDKLKPFVLVCDENNNITFISEDVIVQKNGKVADLTYDECWEDCGLRGNWWKPLTSQLLSRTKSYVLDNLDRQLNKLKSKGYEGGHREINSS